jgi:hypothetical protein
MRQDRDLCLCALLFVRERPAEHRRDAKDGKKDADVNAACTDSGSPDVSVTRDQPVLR